MEAVQMMLKNLTCTLALVGMLSTAALAGSADFDLLWNGHSGSPLDPVPVFPGMETGLNVSLRNNTETALPLGGVLLNFISPTGEVSFDYDGPDNSSPATLPSPNRAAMADDGWQWGGPLGLPLSTTGQAAPAYPLFAGGVVRPFGDAVPVQGVLYPLWSNNPPQTAYDFTADPTKAYSVAGGATVELGTLLITANLGPGPGSNAVLGVNDGGLPPGPAQVLAWDAINLTYIPVELGNASQVNLSVVPEPATLALMAAGGLLGLRRRRTS
jgi:hypothetical protein